MKSQRKAKSRRPQPSPYEERELRKIHEWKQPKRSIAKRVGTAVARRAPRVAAAAGKVADAGKWVADRAEPAVALVIEKTVSGLVSGLNDVALASVQKDAITAEFRKSGLKVEGRSDIASLDLEDIDRTIGWLGAKYKALAAAEGGTTGAAGMLGVPLNIFALVGLSQRAIGEYASYTGLDVGLQHERLFAMQVLSYASSPTDGGKILAMSQLVRISKDVARKTVWKDLERQAFVRIVREIAKALGIRLTKAKLAQVVPMVGGAIGAGFDVYFMSKVCETAYMLYRERFLAEKYGVEIIEAPRKAAKDIESGVDE